MFSLEKMKFNRSLCSWRRTAKFISADGLYEVPAELRTGPGAARGDGREQGHAECVVNTVRQRGLLCTRKFHMEGMDWALYSAMAKCCESSRAKLVTSPTTIVVGLQNQVQFRTNLFNLLPQLDLRSTRGKMVKAPRSYGTLRNMKGTAISMALWYRVRGPARTCLLRIMYIGDGLHHMTLNIRRV